MGKLVKFDIRDMPDILLVGKDIRHSMAEQMKGNNPLPGFWDKCFTEDVFKALEAQANYVFDDAYVGVMADWATGDGCFSYIVGMLMKPGAQVPSGYICRELKAEKVGIGWIQGKDVSDVCSNAHELTEQRLKSDGHSCANMAWCMELYNCPRFTTPDENGEIILDYYIPLD